MMKDKVREIFRELMSCGNKKCKQCKERVDQRTDRIMALMPSEKRIERILKIKLMEASVVEKTTSLKKLLKGVMLGFITKEICKEWNGEKSKKSKQSWCEHHTASVYLKNDQYYCSACDKPTEKSKFCICKKPRPCYNHKCLGKQLCVFCHLSIKPKEEK